jgi:hypothetical protein
MAAAAARAIQPQDCLFLAPITAFLGEKRQVRVLVRADFNIQPNAAKVDLFFCNQLDSFTGSESEDYFIQELANDDFFVAYSEKALENNSFPKVRTLNYVVSTQPELEASKEELNELLTTIDSLIVKKFPSPVETTLHFAPDSCICIDDKELRKRQKAAVALTNRQMQVALASQQLFRPIP